jgi:hypothetical protein
MEKTSAADISLSSTKENNLRNLEAKGCTESMNFHLSVQNRNESPIPGSIVVTSVKSPDNCKISLHQKEPQGLAE